MGLYEQNRQREHFSDLYAKQEAEKQRRELHSRINKKAIAKARTNRESGVASKSTKTESIELDGELGQEIMSQPQTIHPESKSVKPVAIPVKIRQQQPTSERKPWDVDPALFKGTPDPNASQGTLARYYQHRSL